MIRVGVKIWKKSEFIDSGKFYEIVKIPSSFKLLYLARKSQYKTSIWRLFKNGFKDFSFIILRAEGRIIFTFLKTKKFSDLRL